MQSQREVSFPFLSSIKVEKVCMWNLYMCVVDVVKKLWYHEEGGGWFPEEDKWSFKGKQLHNSIEMWCWAASSAGRGPGLRSAVTSAAHREALGVVGRASAREFVRTCYFDASQGGWSSGVLFSCLLSGFSWFSFSLTWTVCDRI